MAETKYDLVVLGAGPAGYVAAIRAAQLGLSVACVEEWLTPQSKPALGGTCLNVGCIPSKALLQSTEFYAQTQHEWASHGIRVKGVELDLARMLQRKSDIVSKMTQGIEFLFRKNKITWQQGHATLNGVAGDKQFKVTVKSVAKSAKGESPVELTAGSVIIATGSKPRHLPNILVDNRWICDNQGALEFDSVPQRLGVIGSGVIGLELGSVWRRLGADVTILEALPNFLAACDSAIAKEALKTFTAQGLKILMGVTLSDVVVNPKSKEGVISLKYKNAEGAMVSAVFDRLIVSVGRIPNTDNLGLESVGLSTDERGGIPVDERCRTAVAGIYAVGDVVRGPMLAHKGEEEGVMAAELIAGRYGHVNYATIPWVIYTSPEIAWVGKTEEQVKKEGVSYKTGVFPFSANGRAHSQGEADGFVKVLADASTDRILGVHVIHAHASEQIAEAVLAMEFMASSEDVARTSHAHPSLSEVMKEAMLSVDKRAIHI